MAADEKPYRDDGSVERVGANLKGAKYTFAVPEYVYDAGIKDFADIAKFKDKLDGKIYGIEPGNDGWPGPYGRGKTGLELYNLQTDIEERINVASKYPQIVERLKALGDKARADIGDSLTKQKGENVRPAGKLEGK